MFAMALAGCAESLGIVPTVSQLRSAVDETEAWETLSTVSCVSAECYNAAFGHTKVRNVQCVGTAPREAECEYEVLSENRENEWEARRSKFGIGSGPDGKISWRLNSPAVN